MLTGGGVPDVTIVPAAPGAAAGAGTSLASFDGATESMFRRREREVMTAMRTLGEKREGDESLTRSAGAATLSARRERAGLVCPGWQARAGTGEIWG